MEPGALTGRVIAVPESREIEIFASMLERRGATVVRCPMVAIRDAPDPAPILDWLRAFAAGSCDDLILMTGEGLRRLRACIDLHQPDLAGPFLDALTRVRKITRGPKPARALRELGLRPDVAAIVPTTDGVIASLRAFDLEGRRVGLQLYGTDPNRPLVAYLEEAGAAVSSVAPYVYADQAEDRTIAELLTRMGAGGIDAIAFTSTTQVERLFDSASPEVVRTALSNTIVAAVGPVVADALRRNGIEPRVMPAESFFLRPLTTVLEEALVGRASR